MDFMMGKITKLINKFASSINVPHIPLEEFSNYMNKMSEYLAQANVIFPVDDLLLMLSILIALTVVMFIIWSIAFVRNMLPF